MAKRVIVIGGGPAGMMAAGTAASFGCDVVLIEKNKILGKKLLITGSGRCNVTNYCDVENVMKNINSKNPKFMYKALNEFSCYDTYAFFEQYGVPLKVERGNRVFPVSDKAADVRDALLLYLKKHNVKIVHDTVLEVSSAPFLVKTFNGQYSADAVVVATGGISYPLTGSTGDGYKFARVLNHNIVEPEAALVALVGSKELCSSMAGLSLKNISINVYDENNKSVYSDFGEMLFTHTGVSGPVILSASCKLDFKRHSYKLIIDLKPALLEQELDKRILKDFGKYKNKDFINSLSDLLPRKIIPNVVSKTRIDPREKVNNITKENRRKLVNVIKGFDVVLEGKAGLEEAIVTSGGVDLSEINPKTMESKTVKGLYFAGETLDVDANTGGYNLQIAFSSGFLAGKSCVGE